MYIDTKKMRYYTLTIEQPIAQERNGLNEKEIQGGFFYEEKSIKCITYIHLPRYLSGYGYHGRQLRESKCDPDTIAKSPP